MLGLGLGRFTRVIKRPFHNSESQYHALNISRTSLSVLSLSRSHPISKSLASKSEIIMHTEIPSIGDIKLFISKLDIGVVEEFISKLESITTSSKATSAGSKSYVDKMLVAMSAVDAKMGGLEKQEMASKSESVSVSKDEEMASKSESVSVSKDEEMASKSESASVSKDETAVNAKMVGPEKLEMASKSESASLSKDVVGVGEYCEKKLAASKTRSKY